MEKVESVEKDETKVPAPPPRKPGPTWERGLLWLMAVALATLFLTGAAYLVLTHLPEEASTSPTPPAVNASLSISPTPVRTVAPGFWGLNVRADQGPTASMLSYIAPTPVKTVRWPGGNLGERYNMTARGGAGLLTSDNGTTAPPAWTTAQFVGWCLSLRCEAIFTVPAEIDRPEVAASFVAYVETNLSFHPSYWEIGNEPALWTHFGQPWSNWSAKQQIGISPAHYADVVHAYVLAMRLVDPNLRFIGLGGVGTGGGEEAPWITATVRENGPNLTAIAIHVYPAGGGTPGETDAAVYASLTGRNGLAHRVPHDLAAMDYACPGCHLQLLVDEFNAASGSVLADFMSGFRLVPYVTAELEEGLTLNVSSMDLWVLESNYPGSLFSASGSARPISTLYTTLLPRLGPVLLPTHVTSLLPDLYALATENRTGPPGTSLLIANLNATYPARVSLNGSGFPLQGSGIFMLWDAALSAPEPQPLGLGVPSGWVLPPESIGLWVGGSLVSGPLHASPSSMAPSPMTLSRLPATWATMASDDLMVRAWGVRPQLLEG